MRSHKPVLTVRLFRARENRHVEASPWRDVLDVVGFAVACLLYWLILIAVLT